MGDYFISVVNEAGVHLDEFTAAIAFEKGTIVVSLCTASPTLMSVNGDEFPSGAVANLYIKGPARPGDEQNFAHRENIRLSGSGEIIFKMSDCIGAQSKVESTEKMGVDPNSLTGQRPPPQPVTEPMQFTGGAPETVDLICVPVWLTVVDDGLQPTNPGYYFAFHFAGTKTWIIDSVFVGAGEQNAAEVMLPAGRGTVYCIYRRVGKDGKATGPINKTEILLRGDYPMGASISIVPDRNPATGP